MDRGQYYPFYLPSRDTDDIADINLISNNFRIIDSELYSAHKNVGELSKLETKDKTNIVSAINEVSGSVVGIEKYANQTYSNAIKGTVSGTGIVQLNKVSPIEHELDVRLSSKNQANHGEIILNSYYRDSSYSVGGSSSYSRFAPIACKPNTTYTMSSNVLFYSVWQVDGNNNGIKMVYLGGKYQPYTFTTPENCEYIALTVYNTKGGEPNPFEWLQLEEGTEATPYTPYIDVSGITVSESTTGKTYTSDADGIVAGVKSVSPVTTLTTNDGVVITAVYNKDAVAVVNGLMERIAALEAAIVSN